MTRALAATGLVKRYRAGFGSAMSSVEALRGLDMDVATGELLGLLGPNGAGKSTFLLCAAGLLRPDAGEIHWFGLPMAEQGPDGIAYVPEHSLYHRFLTAREALEFYATLHDLPGHERGQRVAQAIERVGLTEHRDKRVSQLSRGMVQRLGIAQAIIGRPRLVLLDETLSGLDPVGARHIRDLLRTLRDDGVTIILSSHDLAALEQLATRIVVMKDGRSVASLDPTGFTGARWLAVTVDAPVDAARLLRDLHPDLRVERGELRIPLGHRSDDDVLADVRRVGVAVVGSRVHRDDLEQRFFELIERPARVAEATA